MNAAIPEYVVAVLPSWINGEIIPNAQSEMA
jgi:hypothetical protein